MYRRGRDVKIALQVGLCGGIPVDFGIVIDKGKVLALLVGVSGGLFFRFRDRHCVLIMINYPSHNYLDNAMNINYRIDLSADERAHLQQLTTLGRSQARQMTRAQILLMADQRAHTAKAITAALSVSTSTVYRTKREFVEYGIEAALSEGSRPGQPRKTDAYQDALLVSIACSKPPSGCCRWTLSLLAERWIALTDMEQVSMETIRQRLKANQLKPWQQKMWCLGQMDAAYIAQMEHILDLYAEPPSPTAPLVNFDEATKQLVADVNAGHPMTPGHVSKTDYEYERKGVANIFLCFDRHRRWRHAKVTATKKAADFAEVMRALVDEHYPEAERIRVVLDNYATHQPASLYRAFPAPEARRLLRKLEFHYTPKHASWLNMVEIEIGNMNQQCLDRRISTMADITAELAAWEDRRNQDQASINWLFDVDKARVKLNRAYEKLNQS